MGISIFVDNYPLDQISKCKLYFCIHMHNLLVNLTTSGKAVSQKNCLTVQDQFCQAP